MSNQELRKEIKQSGVKMWQIADKIGISDMTLSRKFRYELSGEEKEAIREIIAEIQSDSAFRKQSAIKQGV